MDPVPDYTTITITVRVPQDFPWSAAEPPEMVVRADGMEVHCARRFPTVAGPAYHWEVV